MTGVPIGQTDWIEGEPPKDGKAYLAFFPQYAGYVADQRVNVVHWSEWGNGVWDNVSGQHLFGVPTHWMPLPSEPISKTAEGK